MAGGDVELFFALDMLLKQCLAQGVGVALQRRAVAGGGQVGNATVNGLRGVAAHLYMALFVMRQRRQIPAETGLLCLGSTAQVGQLHLGGQACVHLGDAAAALRVGGPLELPTYIPARVPVKPFAVDQDGRGGIQRLAQRLVGFCMNGVFALGMLLLHCSLGTGWSIQCQGGD